MASPQKEDGYTAIANEIMDALCRIRIPGEERQVLDSILRKTYGWGKCEDAIALSQFVEMTGMNKPHIIQAVKGLLLKKVIIVTENSNGQSKVYKFNKDYDQWVPLPKKVMLPKTVIIVTENSNPSLPKTVPTKEKKNLKEKKTTNTTPFSLPDYIPIDTWNAYLAVRVKKKAAQTDYAFRLIISELERLRDKYGNDPVEVLNKSIKSGWADVYQLKSGGNGNGNGGSGNHRGESKAPGTAGLAKSDDREYPTRQY